MNIAPVSTKFSHWLVKIASDQYVADAYARNMLAHAGNAYGVEQGIKNRFGNNAIKIFSFQTREEAFAFKAGIEEGGEAVVLTTYCREKI